MLKSCVLFIYFFDGFCMFYEINKIVLLVDDIIFDFMLQVEIDVYCVWVFNLEYLVICGMFVNFDIYFQFCEVINLWYNVVYDYVEQVMNDFFVVIGCQYQLFEYYGYL